MSIVMVIGRGTPLFMLSLGAVLTYRGHSTVQRFKMFAATLRFVVGHNYRSKGLLLQHARNLPYFLKQGTNGLGREKKREKMILNGFKSLFFPK